MFRETGVQYLVESYKTLKNDTLCRLAYSTLQGKDQGQVEQSREWSSALFDTAVL